jgi:hypothetical protein
VLLVTGTGTRTWLRQIIDVPGEQLPRVRVIEMPAGHAPALVSMDRFLVVAAFHAIGRTA